MVELAVENVLVETQNELSVAAVPLFIAFNVASLVVIDVAGSVVGPVAADAMAVHKPSTLASAIPAAGIIISFPDFILYALTKLADKASSIPNGAVRVGESWKDHEFSNDAIALVHKV